MLNGLWLGFFLVVAANTLAHWLVSDDTTVLAVMVENLFVIAKLTVEMIVLLFDTLTLWFGSLHTVEKAGLVERLAVLFGLLSRRLISEMPPGHPTIGLVTLNFAANGLGLDNVATSTGLRVMKALQEPNSSSTTVSNAQVLFLVLNASSLILLPVATFMYRTQQGAADLTLVFLPILLATNASTLAGLLSVALMQRLHLRDPVVLAYLTPGTLPLAGLMMVLGTLSAVALAQLFSLLGSLTLFSLIVLFLIVGTPEKVPVYESFVEGAKGGSGVARNLLPYLVATLCAVGMPHASGVLEVVFGGIRWAVEGLGRDSRFVEALPTALVKPLSGNVAQTMLSETVQTHSVDSFPALVATIVQGSTETTLYVLAVYFGSVGLRRARHAVGCMLTADLAGIIASIGMCYQSFARGRQASTSLGDVETQGADRLSGLGEYLHLPVAGRVAREVLLVGPGPATLLAAATDIQDDTVELLSIEHPYVIDALVEAVRRADRDMGEQTLTTQLAGVDLFRAAARRAAPVAGLAAYRHFGQSQGDRRYPSAAEPSDQAYHQGQVEK